MTSADQAIEQPLGLMNNHTRHRTRLVAASALYEPAGDRFN
ncbi:hypothetical protein ACWCY1_09260 [Streptomyces goshikiensis]|nr:MULTISPECIES: hypothetical protein [Streptomyces]